MGLAYAAISTLQPYPLLQLTRTTVSIFDRQLALRYHAAKSPKPKYYLYVVINCRQQLSRVKTFLVVSDKSELYSTFSW
eukprot:scaffold4111_cov13-Prasinocladus_malaysianus.AAC.1